MMEFKLVGHETAPVLLKQLAGLRLVARRWLRLQDKGRAARKRLQHTLERLPGTPEADTAAMRLAEQDEILLQTKFAIIEIGNYLMPLCEALDTKAPRGLSSMRSK